MSESGFTQSGEIRKLFYKKRKNVAGFGIESLLCVRET